MSLNLDTIHPVYQDFLLKEKPVVVDPSSIAADARDNLLPHLCYRQPRLMDPTVPCVFLKTTHGKPCLVFYNGHDGDLGSVEGDCVVLARNAAKILRRKYSDNSDVEIKDQLGNDPHYFRKGDHCFVVISDGTASWVVDPSLGVVQPFAASRYSSKDQSDADWGAIRQSLKTTPVDLSRDFVWLGGWSIPLESIKDRKGLSVAGGALNFYKGSLRTNLVFTFSRIRPGSDSQSYTSFLDQFEQLFPEQGLRDQLRGFEASVVERMYAEIPDEEQYLDDHTFQLRHGSEEDLIKLREQYVKAAHSAGVPPAVLPTVNQIRAWLLNLTLGVSFVRERVEGQFPLRKFSIREDLASSYGVKDDTFYISANLFRDFATAQPWTSYDGASLMALPFKLPVAVAYPIAPSLLGVIASLVGISSHRRTNMREYSSLIVEAVRHFEMKGMVTENGNGYFKGDQLDTYNLARRIEAGFRGSV